MKIIVVVPAYNEDGKISDAIGSLGELREELRQKELDVHIYVVNDGSTDSTARLAKEAGADRILTHKINQGLGAAVRTGLMAASRDGADIAVKFDADLQHDPADIPDLISPIISDEADIVYGNRFERITYRMPFVRRVGNLMFTWLMRSLTRWPLKDSQPGIFAVSRAYLRDFTMPGDYNYTQQILLDAYHRGMRFAHVPVAFKKRMTGRSFVSLKYPFKVLPQLVRVLVCVKPLRVFGLVGLVFLLPGVFVFIFEYVQFLLGVTDKPVIHAMAVGGLILFGLQTLFFGLLADLIVQRGNRFHVDED